MERLAHNSVTVVIMINMTTKQDILKEKLQDYLASDKIGKGEILDHIVAISNMNRKSVIRRLNFLQYKDPARQSSKPGPTEKYGPKVTIALKDIWQLFHEICAERLHDNLPEYVRVLKEFKEWNHDKDTTDLLLEMSLATCKRRIQGFVSSVHGDVGKGSTKPSLLKEIIPIRRGPWDNPKPGHGEIDSVAHCGHTLIGSFAYTVQYTDVSTIWTVLGGQWNKGQSATILSIERIKSRLPFELLGLDPDSGSEFINWLLKGWCDHQNPIVILTRIRPGRKNDHARIEQKNYTNVRQFVGYLRIDNQNSIKTLNQLYDSLEDYINFFLPSQKCIEKMRVGSRYKRVYDKTQTAYARVLAHADISESAKQALREKYANLNPRVLKRNIDKLIKQIIAQNRTTK